MSSTNIADYLHVGAKASRPPAPSVSTDTLGIYFASDTLEVSYWNGSAWTAWVPLTPTTNVQTLTSASTITPDAANDIVAVSALAANATIANPTGTATVGQGFVLSILDNGTARTLTFGSNYVAMGAAFPITTTAGKLI